MSLVVGQLLGCRDAELRAVDVKSSASNLTTRVARAIRDRQSAGFGRIAPPPGRVDSESLFGSYSETSPHWPHIRAMVTDFRTQYQPPAPRAKEIAWAAAHFDFRIGGDTAAYKQANPGMKYFPYALFWTLYVPGPKVKPSLTSGYYDDMVTWFGSHTQWVLENAFLHRPEGEKTEENRLVIKIWDSQRYVVNPGDPGLRAYEADRLARIATGADGVFLDEFGSGGMHGNFKGGVLEYPDLKRYDADLAETLAVARAAIGSRLLLINTAEYMYDADRAMILAAGAAHLERMNNPLYGGMEERWQWIDQLLARGVMVELVSLDSWEDVTSNAGVFRALTAGEYGSKVERFKMWELSSYYMTVPEDPSRFALDMENAWRSPYSDVWLKAEEANIGHPKSQRTLVQKGVDPTGKAYHIWGRDFDRALVLVRTVVGWDKQRYDDSTGVAVTLPSGATWRPLRGNGDMGPPVTSIVLRNAEAAILIKSAQ